jgi:hypothetical protein
VPDTCGSCAVLERWLRDLKAEIEEEISKRERGFNSPGDERVSRQLLDEAQKVFAETEALYERHRRTHEVT